MKPSFLALGMSVVPAAVCALLVPAWFGRVAQDPSQLLVPGEPIAVKYFMYDDPPIFRVDVPRAAIAVRVWTERANCDLQLEAWFGGDDEYEYELQDGFPWADEFVDEWIDEELWLHITGGTPLEAGPWFFQASMASGWLLDPHNDEVAFTIHCEVIVPERQELPLNTPITVTVQRATGLFAAFECEIDRELVERDAPLRIEVVSQQADVDLVVGPRSVGRTHREAYERTLSGLSFERAVVPASTTGRRFAVQAFAFPDLDPFDEVELTVLLTLDELGAPTLCPPPQIPPVSDGTPLERALAATVSLVTPMGGGSGVVVSPRGHVLTNAHVVAGLERGLGDDGPVVGLALAFDVDRTRPIAPTLGARILEYDERRDLALLLIDSDLLRNPLPEGTTFPSFERIPDGELPSIGDPVWCIGYPMTGGTHTYLTVSATSGMFSGYSPEPTGLEYKVDAAIHSGMSGGACIDAHGRLIGLPSSSVNDANAGGSLGFVIPLATVPAAWWKHLE